MRCGVLTLDGERRNDKKVEVPACLLASVKISRVPKNPRNGHSLICDFYPGQDVILAGSHDDATLTGSGWH